MIISQEKHFIKATEEFKAMVKWIDQADGKGADEEGLRIDQVERDLFGRLLALGFSLLEAYVAKFGCAMRARRSSERTACCAVRPSHTGAGTCRSLES